MLKKTIEKSKKIAIFGHEYIDGDCIGSMLGLGRILEKMKKKVSYFTTHPVPASLHFVKGYKKVKTQFDYGKYDLLIFVDFTPYYRISGFTLGHESYFDKQTIAIIDHHEGEHPKSVKKNMIIKDIDVCSCCELIYETAQKQRPKYIDKHVATYFYLGLTTDSGNFLYEKDSVRIFKNAKNLIKDGADKKTIIQNMFYSNDFNTVNFSSTVINRAKLNPQKNILYTYYLDSELEENKLDKEQGDLGFNILRSIKGPIIKIRFRIHKDKISGSVRGNGKINCAKMCLDLFQGGGHYNASGFSITFDGGEYTAEIEKIIKTVEEYTNSNSNKTNKSKS